MGGAPSTSSPSNALYDNDPYAGNGVGTGTRLKRRASAPEFADSGGVSDREWRDPMADQAEVSMSNKGLGASMSAPLGQPVSYGSPGGRIAMNQDPRTLGSPRGGGRGYTPSLWGMNPGQEAMPAEFARLRGMSEDSLRAQLGNRLPEFARLGIPETNGPPPELYRPVDPVAQGGRPSILPAGGGRISPPPSREEWNSLALPTTGQRVAEGMEGGRPSMAPTSEPFRSSKGGPGSMDAEWNSRQPQYQLNGPPGYMAGGQRVPEGMGRQPQYQIREYSQPRSAYTPGVWGMQPQAQPMPQPYFQPTQGRPVTPLGGSTLTGQPGMVAPGASGGFQMNAYNTPGRRRPTTRPTPKRFNDLWGGQQQGGMNTTYGLRPGTMNLL